MIKNGREGSIRRRARVFAIAKAAYWMLSGAVSKQPFRLVEHRVKGEQIDQN